MNQPYKLSFNTNQPITLDTDAIFDFWLHILNLHEKWILVIYNMWHMDKVSLVPFLIILTIIAVTRDVAQISTVSFCQYITCWILHHIITYINMIWQVYSVLPSLVILYIFNMSNTNWIMKHWILDQMSQNKLQDPDSCNPHPVKSRCGNIWICCARIAILHISCYLPQIRL